MQITHVIYDLDGLLLDTERLYTEATRDIARRYGKTFDWSVKSLVIGKRALDSATILTRLLDLPISPAEYLSERNEVLEPVVVAGRTAAGRRPADRTPAPPPVSPSHCQQFGPPHL